MMLITLTILLPLVHTVAGECQAVEFNVVHTSSLPGPIKEQIQKEGYTLWNDRTSLGVYYKGFPDVTNQKVQFIAGCAVGMEDRKFHYCVNATAIGDELDGHNITVEAFQQFYKDCNNDHFPDLNKFKVDDEDDLDIEKDEENEELQELEEFAKGNRV
uniref:Uncharacterized protein n=1 Tax=Haemonchus contortus TaxID=6289 RepID=A0A7I4XZ52_HAECO